MSVHGHDVLNFMLTQEGFTKESLIASIEEKFGKEICFHTCSQENMSAAELVEFLEMRGKFINDTTGTFNTHSDKICSH